MIQSGRHIGQASFPSTSENSWRTLLGCNQRIRTECSVSDTFHCASFLTCTNPSHPCLCTETVHCTHSSRIPHSSPSSQRTKLSPLCTFWYPCRLPQLTGERDANFVDHSYIFRSRSHPSWQGSHWDIPRPETKPRFFAPQPKLSVRLSSSPFPCKSMYSLSSTILRRSCFWKGFGPLRSCKSHFLQASSESQCPRIVVSNTCWSCTHQRPACSWGEGKAKEVSFRGEVCYVWQNMIV